MRRFAEHNMPAEAELGSLVDYNCPAVLGLPAEHNMRPPAGEWCSFGPAALRRKVRFALPVQAR